MKYSIICKTEDDPIILYLLNKLPIKLKSEIEGLINSNHIINEIRIKKNSFIYLISNGKNLKTDIFIDENEIENIFEYICQGSLYAHIDTLKEGYIQMGSGIRAGVCGTAILDNGQITGIKDVTSINIRIPQKINNASSYVFSLLEKTNFSESILIYSSPGVGKTSILRDLVLKLSKLDNGIRFAVIDTREEIIINHLECSNADIYLSYPKGVAIELATKSMTPEIIICDEISNESEANAILKSSHSGVTLIATTHASSFTELKEKSILTPLIKSGVFKHFIGVERKNGEKKYKFTLNSYFNEEESWK